MDTITARIAEIVDAAQAYGETPADLRAVAEDYAADGETGIAGWYREAAELIAA